MKDMILFPEDIDRLNAVLAQLVSKANLLLAVLINKDGRLLTNQGSLEHIDIVSLAALVAGNSASTVAIASLMGETEFSTMYHQGKDKNIYIAIIDENTFIALVFDDRTNIDRVKVFARQFDRQLKESLFQVYNKEEDQIDLDLDMGGGSFETLQKEAGPNASSSEYHMTNLPSEQQQPDSGGQAQRKQKNADIEYIDLGQENDAGKGEQLYADEQKQHAARSSGSLQEPPIDTKYLYLQNKIRETIKGKSNKQG